MSEPVSNVEIEDVLSSIRRLVSDEARTPKRSEARLYRDESERTQGAERTDKIVSATESVEETAPALVLTEALRVIPTEADVAKEDDAQDQQDANAQAVAPLVLEPQHIRESSPVETVEEARGWLQQEERHDVAQVRQEGDTSRGIFEPEEQGVEHSVSDAANVQAADIASQAEQQVGKEDLSDLSEEQLVAAAPFIRAAHLSVQDHDERDDTAEVDDQVDQGDADEPRSIEEKIAALEALNNRSDAAEFEPDGAEEGENAGTHGDPLPWEDSAPEQSAEMPHVDLEEASEAPQLDEGRSSFERAHEEAVRAAATELEADAAETLGQTDDSYAVLDEEVLRDMVAEIVRQELQGPLGERIARNVRKLVRREIYRALAANELD